MALITINIFLTQVVRVDSATINRIKLILIGTIYDNLQATKLFIVTSATKGEVVTTPLRFSVRFTILYRAIQRLIQHCLLSKMVYLNVKYVITTRSYEFFYVYAESHWKYHTSEGYYICSFSKLKHKVYQKV